MNDSNKPAPRLMIALALLAVYVIWGSTYLAILFAIDTIPPLTMAGIRFIIAGGLLYGLLRLRGHPAPTKGHWVSAAIVGILLLGFGNGGVTWAEQRVPSGIAALILAGTPAWMVILDWIRPGGRRPERRIVAGVLLGLAGIAVLVLAGGDPRADGVDPIGAIVVLMSSISWAFGSILSRFLRVPASAMQVTSMQMIAAGAVLTVGGAVAGEWPRVDLGAITPSSLLAFGYLVVFGSWVGYSAYVWLLRATTPAVASTYAYVNPAIAVLLGWAIAGESVDRWMVGAMALIVCGVAMITVPREWFGAKTGRVPAGPGSAASASGQEALGRDSRLVTGE